MTSSLPTAMNAVRVHQPGGLDSMVLESKVPVPEFKANEVLIKVLACGVNFIDTYHRSGLYKLPTPFILGREGAGEIVAMGRDVKEFKVGEQVAFLTTGTYAEYTVAPADKVVAIPSGMSVKQAAACLLQGLTAHYLACTTYPIKQGDTVLVHAGAGGTGGLLVQVAKLRGARVITTVSSAEKAALATSLGADHVINYNQSDFLEEVKKITEGQGVEAVYDGVGKNTWEKSKACLKRRGTLVLFGNASGPVPPIDPLTLTGSIFLTRPSLFDYVVTHQEFAERCTDLFGWISAGKLSIQIAKEFPLTESPAAHEFLTGRLAFGKVLIIP